MEHAKRKIAPKTFLAQLPLFDAMGPDELDRIAVGTTELQVPRGGRIFQRGDPCNGFHVVLYGQVKLAFTSAQGSEKVLELIGPRHSFGEAVMFLNKPYFVSAQALADTMLLHVSKATVMAELAHDPALACKMLAGLSRRMHGLICDLESVCLQSGVQRVIGFLLKDEAAHNGGNFRLDVSKSIVASRLNLTPEHFSRILSDLGAQDMIKVVGRQVTILDAERLRAHSG